MNERSLDGEEFRSDRSAHVGLIGALVIGLNAVSEVAFTPTVWSLRVALAAIGAITFFGFFVPAILGWAGEFVATRGAGLRRAAFWSPLLVGLGLGLADAAAGGMLHGGEAIAGLVLGGIVAAVAQRHLPTLAEPPDGTLAPLLLGWVLLSSHCVSTLADVARPVTQLMVAVPILCGLGSILLQVFYRSFRQRGTGLLVGMLALGSVAGAGLVIWLASWLPSLNSRLKLLVTGSVLVVLTAVTMPLLTRVRLPRMRPTWITAGLVAAGFVGVTTTAPIPSRFGGLDIRTTAGLAVALVSQTADLDGDGFFDVDAGGNDCDDGDATIHPFGTTGETSCLPSPLPTSPPGPSDETPRDVVVIVVDALRADLFDTHEKRARFDGFQAIASESVRFETAYSPGNSTFTSLPSILTGLGPNLVMHAVTESKPAPYDALVSGRWWLDHVDGDTCTALIAQSHDAAAWLFRYYPMDVDVRITEERVNRHLHSSPYIPESFETVLERCEGQRMALVMYADDPHLQLGKGHACAGGGYGGFDCYVDEVREVDKALTGVIEQMKTAGRWDDAAIILTSDHGEAFGERGHVGHTSNVFEEQVRVPLWVRLPGVEGRDETTPVSGLSVGPTASELAGGRMKSRFYPSLVDVVRDGSGADYPAPIAENSTGRMKKAWTSPQSAIRQGDLKLVYDWRTAHARLYDLQRDPEEENPLDSGPRVEALTEILLRTERTLLTDWKGL